MLCMFIHVSMLSFFSQLCQVEILNCLSLQELSTSICMFCFFPNLNSLLLWRSCDTSKMIFGLLIWEGNIYLHSFMFWLSLSSEVINEGSSCFHMKISSLFFCFCLAWNCFFFFLMDDKEEKWASVVFCQKFYPNCLGLGLGLVE